MASPHVLFVEDDPEIRALVADFLHESGFRVTVAQDGEEMDRLVSADKVDLLILDIMLPDEDGLSLCRRVRAEGNLPVIMLTARGREVDRVVGLEEFLSFSNGFLIRHYCWCPLERRVSESASIRLTPPRERRSVTA